MALLNCARFKILCRQFSTSSFRNVKVAVLGAGGGIGQPLSLLLKLSPEVTELRLYDIKKAVGVAVDASHINTDSCVRGYLGPEELPSALEGAEVVVIPAGVPRKPGMSRDDLFNVNASLVKDLFECIAAVCPSALAAVVTNPVNSALPIAAGVLSKKGVFDPRRLFGVTTLDLVRASTFVGEMKGDDPLHICVPCIGGHSGNTIIPLLSQCKPSYTFKDDELVALTKRIQNAGTEVVKAKAGEGSATLSMAYAANRFVVSLCKGLKGEENIFEYAYVNSTITEARYFSSQFLLGTCGISRHLPLPALSKYETDLFNAALPELIRNIEKGEQFINQ